MQPYMSYVRRALEHLHIDRVSLYLHLRDILLQTLPPDNFVLLGVKANPARFGRCR